jgi:hypothetical protein
MILFYVPVLFSNQGMAENRRFPPPWTVDRPHPDSFAVKDTNGTILATVHCRDYFQKWSFGHSKLTSDEARRIAQAISRIPEFMMQRRGFYSRGPGNYRWKASRPFHVALEDTDRRKDTGRRPVVRLRVRTAARRHDVLG